MKRVSWYILIAVLYNLFIVSASGQSLQWVKKAGGSAFDYGNGICSDNSGNVYVTGEYEFNSDFSGTWISCAGVHDIFIAKYNSSGILQWVKNAGGIGGDAGHAINSDADGNIYITGEFEENAAFGNDTLSGLGTLNDVFIAKYDSSGMLQWVRKAGGWLADKGRGISTDINKNVYVIGEFKGTAYFDTIALISSGDKDAFLSKYNAAGDLQWVKKIGGSGTDDGKAISIDQSGNIYVTGYFSDTLDFGGISLVSDGGLDVYVAKYDTLGNLQWAKRGGGLYYDIGRGITTDNAGMVYVTGEFRYIANFDSLSVFGEGEGDVFIACFDSLGNVRWVKSAGGDFDDKGYGITTDTFSNIYITGQFGNNCTFGTTVLSADSANIFIASYDSSGNFRWVQDAGSDTLDSGNGVSADISGNIYVTGGFGHLAYFSNDSVKSNGHTEFFIAKYSGNLTVEPDSASSDLVPSSVNCNSLQAGWTAGNGGKRLVLAKAGSIVNRFPLDGKSYTANPSLGSGSNLGNNNYVVYNDTGNSVAVTGLTPGTTYYFAVFEYNGTGVNTNYLTKSYTSTFTNTDSINVITLFADTSICSGTSINLSASGAISYNWFPASGLSNSGIANPLASPDTTTTYTVTGISNACSDTAIVTIAIKPLPTIIVVDSVPVCSGDTVLLAANGADIYNWFPATGLSDITIANPLVFPSVTTTYTVTGISNGCADSVMTTVIVNNAPEINLGTDTLICANASLALNAGNGFVSYNWSTNLNTPTITVDSTGVGLASITYYVSVIDSNTCSASDSVQITYSICADIHQQEANLYHIKIYPNPTDGIFNLQLDYFKSELLGMRIFNVTGDLIYEEQINITESNCSEPIDLRNFEDGIYLLRIETADESFSKILIKGIGNRE